MNPKITKREIIEDGELIRTEYIVDFTRQTTVRAGKIHEISSQILVFNEEEFNALKEALKD